MHNRQRRTPTRRPTTNPPNWPSLKQHKNVVVEMPGGPRPNVFKPIAPTQPVPVRQPQTRPDQDPRLGPRRPGSLVQRLEGGRLVRTVDNVGTVSESRRTRNYWSTSRFSFSGTVGRSDERSRRSGCRLRRRSRPLRIQRSTCGPVAGERGCRKPPAVADASAAA